MEASRGHQIPGSQNCRWYELQDGGAGNVTPILCQSSVLWKPDLLMPTYLVLSQVLPLLHINYILSVCVRISNFYFYDGIYLTYYCEH